MVCDFGIWCLHPLRTNRVDRQVGGTFIFDGFEFIAESLVVGYTP